MRHLVCSFRYSVVPINSSLLTVTVYSSFITTQNIQSLLWCNRFRLSVYLSIYLVFVCVCVCFCVVYECAFCVCMLCVSLLCVSLCRFCVFCMSVCVLCARSCVCVFLVFLFVHTHTYLHTYVRTYVPTYVHLSNIHSQQQLSCSFHHLFTTL